MLRPDFKAKNAVFEPMKISFSIIPKDLHYKNWDLS